MPNLVELVLQDFTEFLRRHIYSGALHYCDSSQDLQSGLLETAMSKHVLPGKVHPCHATRGYGKYSTYASSGEPLCDLPTWLETKTYDNILPMKSSESLFEPVQRTVSKFIS
jgi:hypothetical protein